MSKDKLNILLVDDQPGKLLTYETMLAELGENLVKTSSGNEALQQLLKMEFAVVLLDVCMPQIDGFELAALIRQHPRCQRTAIIFISAVQITNLDQLKGYELGAVDYVSVPVVPELLRARVAIFADLYRKTAALERINRELEQRVAERTAELERDLAERRRLQDALLDADRRKDEFLAVLAHELRNPLAPICNAVEAMRLRPMDDPILRQCRDVIGRQGEQLTRLVDDLLDVSRITRGNIRLEKRRIEVADLVRRALETQQPLIDARKQQVEVQLPPQPLIVDGDLTRLSEAISNLLNNAAKYTDNGGHIQVRVESTDAARGTPGEVRILVRDDGVGIPPEKLGEVFEMFSQIDRTVHRAQGGLGIGLALVRKLVQMHGGQVEARSEGQGKGTEFVLRLPLCQEQTVPAPAPPQVRSAVGAGVRVLVVDDNQDAAETLAVMLRLDGSEVETAHSGPQALQTAARFLPEMVLLDIGMPGMSGYEVARRMRAEAWGADLLIVAQTGWGQDTDRQRTRDAGFDAHLTKPVSHAALVKLMAGRVRSAAAGVDGAALRAASL